MLQTKENFAAYHVKNLHTFSDGVNPLPNGLIPASPLNFISLWCGFSVVIPQNKKEKKYFLFLGYW